MIGTIVVKEIRENLLSVRFYLVFALTVALFVAGSVVSVSHYREMRADFRSEAAAGEDAFRAAGTSLAGIARAEQTMIKTPNPFEFLAEGNEKDLPNRFRGTIYETDFPEAKGRTNVLLRDYSGLSWAFIVSVILSFLAFVLSYDAVTAEKERRTLSLVFANSVRAADVFLGKFLGLWITMGIPLVAGTAAGTLVVALGGITPEAGRIGLFLAASLAFLGLFLLIGLTVSSATSQSLTSAIALLFIWVAAAFIVPSSGRLVAGLVAPAPARARIVKDIETAQLDIYKAKYLKTQAGRWDENVRAPWMPLRSQWIADRADVRDRMYDDYIRKLVRQAAGTRAIVRLSPVSFFSGLADDIAGTGLGRFESFYAQVERYREDLYRFVESRDREDPSSVHLIPLGAWHPEGISGRPVDFSLVPRFAERLPAPADRLPRLISGFAVLVGSAVLVFAFGSVLFVRYDKR